MGRAYQNRKESMAKTAAMKTAVYSRYSREIYMAAKGGGTDPRQTYRCLFDRPREKGSGPIARYRKGHR